MHAHIRQSMHILTGEKMILDQFQIRIRFITACKWLDISRESLRHIMKTDASFPRPIKTGSTKQAPVYFDYNELVQWHKAKLAARDAELNAFRGSLALAKWMHGTGHAIAGGDYRPVGPSGRAKPKRTTSPSPRKAA